MVKNILLSITGLLVGLAAITLITEIVEIVTIGLQSEKTLSELSKSPQDYFAIRNKPMNILLKLIYNTLAAFFGGYLCCVIAKRLPLRHAIILIVIQTLGFVYGMTASEYSSTAPFWLWLFLIAVTALGIIGAAYIYNGRLKRKQII